MDEGASSAPGRPDLTLQLRPFFLSSLILLVACSDGNPPAPPPSTASTDVRVIGSFRVGFMPGGDGAVLPQGPAEGLTLVIDSLTNRVFVREEAKDADPEWTVEGSDLVASTFDFELSVPPGVYQLALIELEDPTMGPGVIHLPTALLEFRLPRAACVYIGRASASYYRLPGGSVAEQRKAFRELTRRVGLDPLHEDVYVALEGGGLVPEFDSMKVDLPTDQERPAGAEGCAVLPADFVDLGGG